QSDATINYIIDGDDPSPTYADLEVESPYNTYKNPGLPPGPISSPGIQAIAAVLQPISNAYYYFLTTDDGDIYYAETYDEHLTNKNLYLK
ncbi:MAG: endolytic transglycosylase MltG, partial [Candidatus Uhrbacteria bacterium]|nr:endolytic transglycosylase MltG [Candidatus Uhrbacteria bacterium]